MSYIKIIIVYVMRIVLRIFYIFPINNKKIIFISYSGKQYSCNPKYIFEYIYKKFGNEFQYIWCLNNKNKLPESCKKVRIVKYLSLEYIFASMTSKFIINNAHIDPIFPFRKDQITIHTWHGGGAYKTVLILIERFLKKYAEIL